MKASEQVLGLVLKRVNYGEADRIVTVLTDKQGTISAIARGVRKQKSKLAGGLEPFSVNEISYLPGKGDLGTITSARNKTNFSNLIAVYDRMQLGYRVLEHASKLIEDETDESYFVFFSESLEELNNMNISLVVIETWYRLQLLRLLGHQPNVLQDAHGQQLTSGQRYRFSTEEGALFIDERGDIEENTIKAWRVLLANKPSEARNVRGLPEACEPGLDKLRALFGELFSML